jgi:hypothetical protein
MFSLFSLPLFKLQTLHLYLNSDVTKESIVITLLFGLVIYVIYYALLLQ